MTNEPTVLVVDDNEDLLETFAMILKRRGFFVETADNGATAVDKFKEHNYDVTLMDIVMPKVDGYNACSQIKADQETKEIPVIMVTGLGFAINEKVAKDLGADGYITKPFNLENLLNLAEHYVPAAQTTP